jgi:ABC-type transport system substrate-binding protein
MIMAEAAARDVAFRNKEIDTSILGPAQYVAYRADPQLSKGILEVAEVFTRNDGHINLSSIKPFSDKRVRQAINHAIDSNLIISRLVKDKAYRATSWLPPSAAGLRQDDEGLRRSTRRRPRSCWPKPAIPTASSSSGRPARTRAGVCRSSRR